MLVEANAGGSYYTSKFSGKVISLATKHAYAVHPFPGK